MVARPTHLELAPRSGDDLAPDEIARAVADLIQEDDYEEPWEDELILDVRSGLLFVKGVVTGGSDEDMIDVLNGSPGVRTVVLTNLPGSANDGVNLSLGRKLREAGVTMYLPARGMVASGGTDLLLSGVRRIVESGAQVGVHSWRGLFNAGSDLPRDHSAHQMFLDYYQEMNIPEDFYWFTLDAAPPSGMHWMSEEEMGRYEVYTVLR